MKDYDSIKEKFDNSGVNAPDTINEQLIKEKLGSAQPVQVVPPKKSKKKVLAGVSSAAAVAVVTAGAIALTSVLSNKPVQSQSSSALEEKVVVREEDVEGLRSFKSREEVRETLKTAIKVNDVFMNASKYRTEKEYFNEIAADADSASGSTGSASGGSSNGASAETGAGTVPNTGADSFGGTYTQSVGVDEADVIKTDGRYIYYLDSFDSEIEIFTADGANSKKAGKISMDNNKDGKNFIEFFLRGDRLVVVCQDNSSQAGTAAYVYDISDIENAKLVDSCSQSGQYVSSRMIGDTLYLVSSYEFYDEDLLPVFNRKPASTPDSAEMNELPFENIYSVENPSQNSFLVLSFLDVKKGSEAAEATAIIGSGDTVYCSRDNMYITACECIPAVYTRITALENVDKYWEGEGGDVMTYQEFYSQQMTGIIKVNLANGIKFTASGEVEGRVNNQYSMDEYNGNLRVATTSMNEDYEDVNNLFVLDEKLNQLGKVTGFAENESIQAVRFIDKTAYVITYRQTDPLFVIDVSNPSKPRIDGEVKISGFSTMLVPVDENTLLGIGYHTEEDPSVASNAQNALKLVTFDVTDRSDPKVLDSKIFPFLSSAVQSDPRALLVNSERGDYTIPTSYYKDSEYRNGKYLIYEVPETNNGLINFRVDNGKINVIDEYSSENLTRYDCYSFNRCVYAGDYQYILSSEVNDNYYYSNSVRELDSLSSQVNIEAVKYK